MNGVYWSESLNKVFVDNFGHDPSLIWQYFGSAKGFFRQYPGKTKNACASFLSSFYYIHLFTVPKRVAAVSYLWHGAIQAELVEVFHHYNKSILFGKEKKTQQVKEF